MCEKKTHLDRVINILHLFLESSADIYVDIIKQLVDSFRIPKLDSSICSVDSFFKSALNKDHLIISLDSKYIYPYQDDISLSENINRWGEIIQHFRTSGSSDNVNWDDINDELLRKELVNHLIEEKKDDIRFRLRLNRFLADKEMDFYYHINKSLLNAEYLYIENYSKRILDELETIERTEGSYYMDGTSFVDIQKPRFIRDFFILAPKMIELCGRIKNAIGERNNRRIETEDHTEENAIRITSGLNIDDNPTSYSDALLHFTQSVIEMTCIDHIYKASSDNIGKLLTLWERIKGLSNIETGTFPIIVNMVKAKTASLIDKMVFNNGDDKSHRYLEIDNFDFFFKDSEKIKQDTYYNKLPEGLNKTINYKTDNKDSTISEDSLNTVNPKLDFSNSQTIQDIVKYNDWVKRGQQHYIQMSSTISTIEGFSEKTDFNQVVDKIYEFINDKQLDNIHEGNNIECFSPFFFVSSIHFVNDRIKKEENDLRVRYKLLDLMYKLLLYLERYIRTYTNSMPTVFRPYFEHCFYDYDEQNNVFTSFELDYNKVTNYDCKNFENSFFFASYNCNAISISRLHDFYERCFLQFQSLSSELTQKQQINFENSFNKRNAELRGEVDIQKEEIKKSQRSSLQTLGLFTGFLAFIVTSIGTFRVAGNLTEYIIYSLTYTLAIILFAFLISDHNTKQYTKENSPNGFLCFIHNWKKYIVYIFSLVALLLFAIYYYTNKNFSKPKEEISITIDKSSIPSVTPNLQNINRNDTTVKNSPIEPVYVEKSNDNSNSLTAMPNLQDTTQNDTIGNNSPIEPVNTENSNGNTQSSNNNASQE